MQETRDAGSIPGSGRSPGGGNGKPFQYSCLKNLMDGEAGWATVRRVANSQTRVNWLSTHTLLKNFKFVVVLFFCFLLWDFLFSSSSKIVCLLLKHQNYCVSLLWRQVSTIPTLIPCMPLCMWLLLFIITFILGVIQTLTYLSLCKNLVKQFVAVCELYLKKMRSFFKKKGNWPNIYNC